MFYNAHMFDQDLRAWETSRVMDVSNIFHDVHMYNLHTTAWDMSRVQQW